MSNSLKRSAIVMSEEETPAKRSVPWNDNTDGHSEDSNRMRVYVRVRPLSDREDGGASKMTIDVIDSQHLVFDPIEETTEDHYVYQGKTYREIGRRPNKNMKFVFNRVFDENIENIQIYKLSTKKFVESLLNGYNCAVFAYGATGSGKTHTMLGSSDDPGVIFFTTMDLFRQIEDKSDEEKLELNISYFEIYNEKVIDLLDPTSGKKLAVREDRRRGVFVQNLSIHQPKDANHLLEMLEYGNRNRTQHPTDSNAQSSRSHAVFQISLKKQYLSSAQEMSVQISKMSLIDLAGSERACSAYKTNRSKGLQREGGNINKSLLELGNCITSLASNDPKKKSSHIPYRNSKLTLILRDSLGGNCLTAMIATVSPSNSHYEETHNTLVYADRAKGIQLNLKQNNCTVGLQPRNNTHLMEVQNRKITDLSEENLRLKMENERLRAKIDTFPKNITSKVAVVAANKRIQQNSSDENQLNDTFTIENNRISPSPARRESHFLSPQSLSAPEVEELQKSVQNLPTNETIDVNINESELKSYETQIIDKSQLNREKISTAQLHTEFPKFSWGEKEKKRAEELDLNVIDGPFTKEENKLLNDNWNQYLKDFNQQLQYKPHQFLGFFAYNIKSKSKKMTKEQVKKQAEQKAVKDLVDTSEMWLRLAKGLPERPVHKIYHRVRKTLSGLRTAKDLSAIEKVKIVQMGIRGWKSKDIAEKFDADVKAIEEIKRVSFRIETDENGKTVKKDIYLKYRWKPEEIKKFNKALKQMKSRQITPGSKDFSWVALGKEVVTRGGVQCWKRWENMRKKLINQKRKNESKESVKRNKKTGKD